MVHTTILIPSNTLTIFQRDFVVKSGFSFFGINLSRSVKSSELHIIINELASRGIPFTLKTNATNHSSKPCIGCKK